MRWALGWHRLGRLGLGWEWVAYPKCALARIRARWLGMHLCRWCGWCRCALCHLRDSSPVRRMRCQHAEVAVAVGARWWHQCRNAISTSQAPTPTLGKRRTSSECRLHRQTAKSPGQLPVRGFGSISAEAFYFFAGGKSVQLPCATSAAIPMDSPRVGCG